MKTYCATDIRLSKIVKSVERMHFKQMQFSQRITVQFWNLIHRWKGDCLNIKMGMVLHDLLKLVKNVQFLKKKVSNEQGRAVSRDHRHSLVWGL